MNTITNLPKGLIWICLISMMLGLLLASRDYVFEIIMGISIQLSCIGLWFKKYWGRLLFIVNTLIYLLIAVYNIINYSVVVSAIEQFAQSRGHSFALTSTIVLVVYLFVLSFFVYGATYLNKPDVKIIFKRNDNDDVT